LHTALRTPLPSRNSTPLQSALRQHVGNGSRSLRHELFKSSGHECVDVAIVPDELRHDGTAQRLEKNCSSGDGSPERCRRPGYYGRVSGPLLHLRVGLGQWPTHSVACTCCVFFYPSHLSFSLSF
jgi:hypothetical protein